MAIRRVLTGIRTTGPLHLGHYVGALKQWLDIQDQGGYECFFLLADVQALTTHQGQPELLTKSVRDVVLDWLAVGLNPLNNGVYFVQQSQIPERYELSMLLMMLADYQKVLRNPTLKSELSAQKNVTLGFIAYPVDQVADIHMISPSEYHHDTEILVPVGEDQVPHLEDARDLVQAFNRQYGKLFNPCQALVGPVGRLVGTDGNDKMSKSKGNSIELSDSPEVVRKKVMRMFTDPNRIRADMPGETVNNPLFIYLRAFDPDVQEVANLTERYQQGKVRDVEVKEYLASVLNAFLDPIRERRAQAEQVDIRQILEFGNNATRQIAQPLLAEVRERMHLTLPK